MMKLERSKAEIEERAKKEREESQRILQRE